MSLPYSYSRLKCKLALDMLLPRLLERKLYESGGLQVNACSGKLQVDETAEVKDCTIRGDLIVGPGSKVISCTVEPGALLNVGANCTVVDTCVSEHVTIGEGSTVCSCTFNSAIHMGSEARVVGLTTIKIIDARSSDAAALSECPEKAIRIGNRLQVCWSELKHTARIPVEIGDDASLLCAGLCVSLSQERAHAKASFGDGLVVANVRDLKKVDTVLDDIAAANGRGAEAGRLMSFFVTSNTLCLKGSGDIEVGDDVRVECVCVENPIISASKGMSIGDHSKLHVAPTTGSYATLFLVSRLWLEPYSTLMLQGSDVLDNTGKHALVHLEKGSTLCISPDLYKPAGMRKLEVPAGAFVLF